jgi:hypothetical protein
MVFGPIGGSLAEKPQGTFSTPMNKKAAPKGGPSSISTKR